MATPKWLSKVETTRARSSKQESKIAKSMRGVTSINSGATFGENDVTTDYCEIEAKTTKHASFKLAESDWLKLESKCKLGKLPIMVIDFEGSKKSLAVMNYSDLQYIINMLNK